MEGAVRSGERVAEEVLAALGWPGGHTTSFSAG
jgi:hypothetical protein